MEASVALGGMGREGGGGKRGGRGGGKGDTSMGTNSSSTPNTWISSRAEHITLE